MATPSHWFAWAEAHKKRVETAAKHPGEEKTEKPHAQDKAPPVQPSENPAILLPAHPGEEIPGGRGAV